MAAPKPFPDSVAALAFRSSSGELAWRREDLPVVLDAIVASRHAVLGGEVWVVRDDGAWEGLVPDRRGGPPGVWHWTTAPRAPNETWLEYCRRTAAESARTVAAMQVDDEAAEDVRNRLRFNLTCIEAGEWRTIERERMPRSTGRNHERKAEDHRDRS